jgi:hypothetical protein
MNAKPFTNPQDDPTLLPLVREYISLVNNILAWYALGPQPPLNTQDDADWAAERDAILHKLTIKGDILAKLCRNEDEEEFERIYAEGFGLHNCDPADRHLFNQDDEEAGP